MKCQKSKIFEHVRKKQGFFQTKSQITIFIVLGIVIVIIFGLVSFISNQSSDVVLEKRINKIYGDFLSASNIHYIADDCLERTTKEALLLVGLQGGRIYDYQIEKGYNITSFYDVVPYNYSRRNQSGEFYNISYGIKAPVNTPPPQPADYPYLGSLTSNVHDILQDFFLNATRQRLNSNEHIFADVKETGKYTLLAPLCNNIGPNDPSILDVGRSCETTSPNNKSTQEYIKLYISQHIEDCINFTLKTTSQYNISVKNTTIAALIGEKDLLVSLNYPIEISLKNRPPVTKYIDFNIRPQIRLKTIHEIASHLIGHNRRKLVSLPNIKRAYSDANNIFFDITKDDPNNCFRGGAQCIIPGISVSKLQDYCLNNNHCYFNDAHYNYSDIIIIEDNNSIIYGKPYQFLFAIENRRPALDFIDESVEEDKYYYQYLNATYEKNLTETYSNTSGHPSSLAYNIILDYSETLEIFPLALDPDEDNLTYNYTVIDSPLSWTDDDFKTSNYYINGFPGANFTSGFASDHNLSKDINLDISLPSATFDNIVMINVSDNEGLYDYQNLTIRVVLSP